MTEQEKRRCVEAILRSTYVQGPLKDDDMYEALCDVLVKGQWPRPDLTRWYELERRKTNRTTDPGGVDGPPFDRPMANNQNGIEPEAGARQGSDDDLGIPPERYLPV